MSWRTGEDDAHHLNGAAAGVAVASLLNGQKSFQYLSGGTEKRQKPYLRPILQFGRAQSVGHIPTLFQSEGETNAGD